MFGIAPDKSIMSIASDLGRSESMIRICVAVDLRYKSYKMRKDLVLIKKAKEKWLTNSVKLLKKLKLAASMIWFFNDEKNFCQDQKKKTTRIIVDLLSTPRMYPSQAKKVSCYCHGFSTLLLPQGLEDEYR